MKVYLCHDTREQVNWGCKATTSSLIDLIISHGGKIIYKSELSKFQTLKVSSSFNFLKKFLKYDSTLRYLIRKFLWNIQKRGGIKSGYVWKYNQFQKLAELITGGFIYQEEYSKMQEADMIIINGEGSIYRNELKGILIFFFAYFASSHLNKICILANHHADLSHPNMYDIAKNVYPTIAKVVFRDPLSMEKYLKLSNNNNFIYGGDAAFKYKCEFDNKYLNYDSNVNEFKYKLDNRYILVGGSSLLMRPDEKIIWPINNYKILIEKLLSLNIQIVLIAADSTDDFFLNPISKDLGLNFIPSSTKVSTAYNILKSARCLITGRWHSGVLASIGGTPVVALSSNSKKMEGLNKIFGFGDVVYDAFNVNKHANEIFFKTKNFILSSKFLFE